MASVQDTRQNLPLGEGAPACRGERGRRDAVIHSDIPGKTVRCTDSPQNVRKIAANRSPLQPRFARQLPPREALVVAGRFAIQRTWFVIAPGSGG